MSSINFSFPAVARKNFSEDDSEIATTKQGWIIINETFKENKSKGTLYIPGNHYQDIKHSPFWLISADGPVECPPKRIVEQVQGQVFVIDSVYDRIKKSYSFDRICDNLKHLYGGKVTPEHIKQVIQELDKYGIKNEDDELTITIIFKIWRDLREDWKDLYKEGFQH